MEEKRLVNNWRRLSTGKVSVCKVRKILEDLGYLRNAKPTIIAKMHGLAKDVRGKWVWDRKSFRRVLKASKRKI